MSSFQLTVVRRILHVLCTVLFGMNAHGWAQTELSPLSPVLESVQHPIRLPSASTVPATIDSDDAKLHRSTTNHAQAFALPADITDHSASWPVELWREPDKQDAPTADDGVNTPDQLFHEIDHQTVRNAFGTLSTEAANPVRTIPTFIAPTTPAHRIVRYEVPLEDEELNRAFLSRGIEGRLIEVSDKSEPKNDSISDRIRTFLSPTASWQSTKKVRVVRYEVPADDILFHAQLSELDGQILEPGMLRLPEVRFFQPKARVFMDLKQSNDGEFDLFNDGAILASLDVIELYFPMPLISERFAEMFGMPGRLTSLGWRVGGTLGLGITTGSITALLTTAAPGINALNRHTL